MFWSPSVSCNSVSFYFCSDLVAVLTNALYFKADWQNKFKKESTFKREFFSSADSKREIDFLHASAVNRNYAENDQFQVLSLPYKDETFALTIFLPKTRFGLSDALKNLDSASIQHLMSNVSNELVNVSFKVSFRFKHLGCRSEFQSGKSKPDWDSTKHSRLLESRKLSISRRTSETSPMESTSRKSHTRRWLRWE